MYAIIATGGKQYKVEVGQEIYVEKLGVEEDASFTFDKVVAVAAEDGLKAGTPYIEGATVEAAVVKNGKGRKIDVFTYKRRKGQKRAMGHRQPYTKVEITAINV